MPARLPRGRAEADGSGDRSSLLFKQKCTYAEYLPRQLILAKEKKARGKKMCIPQGLQRQQDLGLSCSKSKWGQNAGRRQVYLTSRQQLKLKLFGWT
uniref:Uncharacterized protein n=1 Tax=Oryza glumipatula TaxID=40148 RepID=A0A0D9Z880_9ORYZ